MTFDEKFQAAYQHLYEAFNIYSSMASCFEYEGPADEDDTSTLPLYLCDNFQETYETLASALDEVTGMMGDWQRYVGITAEQ